MALAESAPLLNPFVVGGALRQQDGYGFFGREDVFQFVSKALHSVQRVPVILYGHRRIGKSSILRQLAYKLSPELVCVYHDLQGSANDSLDDALYGLARDIADKLDMARPEPEEATADLFETSFMPLVVERVGNARRLVLLLDEFDAVDQRRSQDNVAAKTLIPFLGRLAEAGLNIGLVLVLGRRTSELSESFKNWILKDSLEMRIGRLNAAQTTQMIKVLAGPSLSFHQEAIDRVFEIAAGHPYCSQVLCYAVWQRYAGRQSEIFAGDVNSAIEEAIDFGGNGMTWVYDGLELAEQRLFISTLSETMNPLQGAASSLDDIQNFLRDHRLSIGQADLDSAARDLAAWDIIRGTNTTGYRFVVPLLGAWVRRERPVFQLEQEIQFANPRAWSFYELARESEQHGDLDGAIVDYHNSLIANPVFLEAQRRLATTLQRRNQPGDLLAAIEAWERVLELDAGSPRAELLDALMLALDITEDTTRTEWIFQKIDKLDTTNQVRERAIRNIRQRAADKMVMGSRQAVGNAARLYERLGDAETAATARQLRARQDRIESIGVGVAFASIIAAFGLGYVPFAEQLSELRVCLCSLAGIALLWGDRAQRDGKLAWRQIGIIGFALGAIAGEVLFYLVDSMFAAGFVAVLTGGVAANWKAANFPLDSSNDPLTPPQIDHGPLFNLFDVIAKNAATVRDRLATRPQETKEQKG